jgi:hypothetical protein
MKPITFKGQRIDESAILSPEQLKNILGGSASYDWTNDPVGTCHNFSCSCLPGNPQDFSGTYCSEEELQTAISEHCASETGSVICDVVGG